MKKLYFFILWFLIGGVPLIYGQAASHEELQSLFEDSSSIQWFRDYKGLINNIENVDISLAFDGRNCKGYVLFPKSGTTIELSGNIRGNRLDLRELNEEGLITAYLTGSITPGMIQADWENYNHTIGCKYVLFSEKESKKIAGASKKKWVKWYIGEIAHEKLRLILFHKQTTELSGFCFNETGSKMYTVTGKINDDNSVFINFYLDQTEMARFDGKFKGSSLIKGTTTGIGVVNEPLQLELENEIYLTETSYQNFRTSIEILTPNSRDKDFEKYINDKIQPYLEAVNQKKDKSGFSESDIPQPADRLSQRAYIYPDIRFVSKDLICGNILYTNTWDKNDKTIPFNYDSKKEVEIQLDDIWNPKINIRDSLDHYFNSINKSGFSFKYFNLTPQGIRFYDDLNPLFGRNDVTIPYAIIKRWTKRKSLIKNLINED
jgi:hypothetical protein